MIKKYFFLFLTFFYSGSTMADQLLEIKWEWAAGRQSDSKILVQIDKLSKPSKGFLGIGASPSLANSLPDATDVIATVIQGGEGLNGRTISIRLPGIEANKLEKNGKAGFALIGSDVCICVASVPDAAIQKLDDFLDNMKCQ